MAAAGVSVGWCLQMLMYLAVAPGASNGDIRVWQSVTAVYAVAGWLLIGVPVAMGDPASYLARPLRSTLLAGCAGAGLTLVPPAIALVLIAAPLAFIVAAVAMWTYISVVGLWSDR